MVSVNNNLPNHLGAVNTSCKPLGHLKFLCFVNIKSFSLFDRLSFQVGQLGRGKVGKNCLSVAFTSINIRESEIHKMSSVRLVLQISIQQYV